MSSDFITIPRIEKFFRRYLKNENSADFIRSVAEHYTEASLQRIAIDGSRATRRAAVLAIGFVGSYQSNPVLGRALHDADRAVRLLAENGMRAVWERAAGEHFYRKVAVLIRLNAAKQHDECVAEATELICQAPEFAEAWNQRAIAYLRLQQHELSLDDCRETLRCNPYHFHAASRMGYCHLEKGNPSVALDCFRRALRLNPQMEGIRAQSDHLQRALRRR